MKIYHQLGHNYSWNIKSLRDDLVGDGFIISPVNIPPEKIEKKFSEEEIKLSFLDPQCYKINAKIKKTLKDNYPYLSKELSLFNREQMEETQKIAVECLNFQLNYNFKYYVIPTVDLELDLSYALKALKDRFVVPFLNEYKEKKIETKILLTVIVKNLYIESEDLREYLLDWITSFPEIHGVYLIPKVQEEEPVSNLGFTYNFLNFIHTLKEAGMEVHIGYTGTEALLYSVAMPNSITVGVYKNLRSFNTDRFEEKKEDKRAPYPRVFSHTLAYWERFDTALIMCNKFKKENLFDFTKYDIRDFFPAGKQPHFTNNLLYLHYFYSLNKIIEKLPKNQNERIKYILEYIEKGLKIKDEIGIFSENCEHLLEWKRAIKYFEQNI